MAPLRFVQTILLGFLLAGNVRCQGPISIGNWGRSGISLNNNGYSGILAAIDPHVPFNETLINTFKNIFTSASSFLFNATNQRAFFRDVSILIPPSWPRLPGLKFAPHGARSPAANIVVRPTSADVPSRPFVRQPGQCGSPGEYMHLTPEFIMSGETGRWGDPAKVLVHEWGHLNWGLFDEYPTRPGSPQFYISSSGKLEGTKCSTAISGVALPPLAVAITRGDAVTQQNPEVVCDVEAGKIPPPTCRFRPNNIEGQTASGSIMYSTSIPSIRKFCQSDPNDPASFHSSEAPTEQNRLCAGQSSWDIMLKSPDFLNNRNPPPPAVVDTTPSFTLMLYKNRTVLVIDRSNSMPDDEYWNDVIRMSKRFVDDAPADSLIGIVTYSRSKPITRAPLTAMSTQGKQSLLTVLDNLPSPSSTSAVNPGAALRHSYYRVILNGTNMEMNGVGSDIILLSGWQGVPPTSRITELRDKGVAVRAVNFGPPGNPRSINISGVLQPGTWYAYQPSSTPENPEFAGPQAEPVFADLENNPRFVQVFRESIEIPNPLPITNVSAPLIIDGSIGRSTTFRFSWDHDPRPVFSLRSPLRRWHPVTPGAPGVTLDESNQQMDFRINNLMKKGVWTISIDSQQQPDQTVDIQVFSAASSSQPPIRARPLLLQREIDVRFNNMFIIYGEVKQGEMPIVGASVKAVVERPGGSDIEITLRDGGIGADTRANDGIYSAYFTQFTEEGSYQIDMKVRGDSRTTKRRGTSAMSGVMPADWDVTEQPAELVSVGPFMRAPPEAHVEVTGDVSALLARDRFPPARVNDLEVVVFNSTSLRVKLRWKAMGDDYDSGRASSYQIRYSSNANVFARNFLSGAPVTRGMLVMGSLTAPATSYITENMIIALPRSCFNPVCAIRLISLDEVGNRAEPSNMVTVVTPSVPTLPPTSDTITSLFEVTTRRGAKRIPTTRRWGFSSRPDTGTAQPDVNMTTTEKSAPPKEVQPRGRIKTAMIVVAVLTILILLTAIVIYTIIRHASCGAGLIKRYRHRNNQWAGPYEATSQTNLAENSSRKNKRAGKRVGDALVLEDI
ncbi:calcium-activated chloride channel regulator 4-like [Diadema antillarum]|uniref:calcium-activated chloride channel regulator 4-like n=1 Tax=Diadema antillarum TaxID=105358 RepID=UPI003A8C1693